ncbi:MAG: hypothetical protein AABX35_00530 [Nanoarchaeota archaeon]
MAVRKIRKKNEEKSLFGENVNGLNQKGKKIQISWMWWALMVLVVGFFIFYFIFSKIGTFEYEGLAFDKQGYGKELTLYHHSYFYTYNKQTYKNNVYLRFDPRDNEIPVDSEILFTKGRTVYLGINNTGIINCSDSSIAIGTISQFFANNQFDLKLGTPDINESKERKQVHVNCDKADDDTVIIIQSSYMTKISTQGSSCYIINVNQCEIQPAVEKFIVNSLIDTRDYRESLK